MPNMSNLIDVTNSSDPLNIRLGNPDLKPSWNENLRLNADKRWEHGGDTTTVYVNLGGNISATQNAVSQGYTVDSSTGGRTYKPVNVDGNWSWNADSGFGMDFGKEKHFNLYNSLGYNFSQSVDMVAVAGQMNSGLSKVHNNIWSDNLSLTYRTGDSLSLGISGKVEYRNSTSDQENFNEINATNFSYGFNGMWRVFRTGFTLATDIKMYSRRGYASSDLNTDNLVWNLAFIYEEEVHRASGDVRHSSSAHQYQHLCKCSGPLRNRNQHPSSLCDASSAMELQHYEYQQEEVTLSMNLRCRERYYNGFTTVLQRTSL